MDNANYAVEVDLVNAATWSAELGAFEDANIYQTWPYGSVRWGEKNLSHLVLKRNGIVVGMAQLRIVRASGFPAGVAYLRWGPLCNLRGQALDATIVRQMAKALHEEYVEKRGLFLRILPNAVGGTCRAQLFQSGFQQFQVEPFSPGDSYRTFILDLTRSLPDLRKALEQKWRNQLNRAGKNELTIIEGSNAKDFRTMQEVFDEMWQRKQFKTTSSIRDFAQIQQYLPPTQRMKVMICLSEGTPVSAMIATAMGNSGIYLFGGTTDQGLTLKGSYLLQWRMIEWMKQNGVEHYNLGGINPETNPGVYHFKRGMAGQDVLYLEPMVACNNLLSRSLVRMANVGRRTLLPSLRKLWKYKPIHPAKRRQVTPPPEKRKRTA